MCFLSWTFTATDSRRSERLSSSANPLALSGRNAGSSDVQRVRTAFGERTIRRTELDGHGFLTVLGGFLLLIPGFVTDVLGALLLLPPTQHAVGAA